MLKADCCETHSEESGAKQRNMEGTNPINCWEHREGMPFPLGVSHDPTRDTYNFALYSKNATSVTLLLFREDELSSACVRQPLDIFQNKSGPIWHCRLASSELHDARYYAYCVDGPEPGPGYASHAFDPQKLLLDPYARSFHFPPTFDRDSACRAGSNLGKAALGRLDCGHASTTNPQTHPVRHGADLIIYEMHVKGFTYRSEDVTADRRGTFLGIIEKIPYLVELGITAIELMPIFQFDPASGNYWGYMPIGFFAPHQQYASTLGSCTCRQYEEFRSMVKALHEAGIEVILDVVYNHSGELGQSGPKYSLKGLDNTTYYLLNGNQDDPYSNFSGCGNTLQTSNRAVRQLILDSLKYWAREMGVDGFRFDMASIFCRNPDGSINSEEPPIFAEIATDPQLARLRLIAEPWDASGLNQLGSQFPGTMWFQWNARYRDTLRRFMRGDAGLLPDLMTRIYGSSDLFPDDPPFSCRPFQSINYICSHDGFTLYDLVSYTQKRNWSNGEGNKDGPPDEVSWNCGWEGDDAVPYAVMRLRKQQARNLFCLLMLSNGTPMIRMGDEFLQTQGGNNNPYNQDNETSWLNWDHLRQHADFFNFCKRVISFRKAHPSLSRSRFWRNDVTWFGPNGSVDLSDRSQTLGIFLAGYSEDDADIIILINGSKDGVEFDLRFARPSGPWAKALDTAIESPDVIETQKNLLPDDVLEVSAHSVVLLINSRAF